MNPRIPHAFKTDDEYRAAPGENWSRLKHLRTSPKVYRYRIDNPEADTSSRGMLRATHCLALEPSVFNRDFAVYEGRRDKRAAAYKAFLADAEGKTVLSPRELSEATAVADAVKSDPAVRAMLDAPGVEVYYELPILWTDPVFGVPCKAKLDILIVDWEAGTATVVDLKTVRRIDPRGMARDAEQMGYHGQIAGHYARAAAAVTGFHEDAIECAIIAVEGKAPHDVGIFAFSPADVWQGRRLRDSLMTRRAECIAADNWPGKVPAPVSLDLPCYDAGLNEEPEITIGG